MPTCIVCGETLDQDAVFSYNSDFCGLRCNDEYWDQYRAPQGMND